MNINHVKFDDRGLIPAIVQDAQSKEVLTLAYMNKESLQKTLETRETWFFSRSRQELWHKGATSGNVQKVVDVLYDCDSDALVVKVIPAGPACHKNVYSCFSDSLLGEEAGVAENSPADEKEVKNRFAIINRLETLIATREAEMPEGSYTTYLFTEGVDKILKKVGEEASEVIIAAKNRSHDELRYEAADLLFHLLVLLREQKLPFDAVLQELEKRHAR
ncbi:MULTISPECIES: bifunctional phosphoribosyl-AMP cyclohydrolase/phosphoribosyl-ATP diphosphatase HisIE [Aneurinibacillus]|uniref:Histidine biosynthesis bifunctional protein HisIE n=1 Tax=Aneurinibacillus thermoaerophilus TaxID=143495 RepID=A0A1G8E9D0_ANETH|nr:MULTISPECIES: bifunctional phosphoribosyl-AMP cyclohydrolase/phosphoribosyl-ATP diphosphatase HisIE [Aneurinibacillus]AMA71782.1 bifunctional phosphoribosyl-AMP cyclohydrolase/phosphoribosyl-ATP pyrophosphatase [Aneurinibacillus sp. XH2]MED0676908.1 bifunctional phosphoribosyl-AMP cyclohydrolase/phosphoribosyl-ATP diphosphatase HisIE [Aneurinibacillus thermoaerophilus]MED0680733.1 bifunctional phosphoribosyl-AMP cyclohydrolase/phosphoribosyl-ATP diphosphatase HisIE [Aneurinibacillus thermoaer